MAVLGKRKASQPAESSNEDANEAFRRYFETQFAPLPTLKRSLPDDARGDNLEDLDSRAYSGTNGDAELQGKGNLEGEDDDSDDEWGGLTDGTDSDGNDDSPSVEIVDHSVSRISKTNAMSKRELKIFMSSKIPDQTNPSKSIHDTQTSSPKGSNNKDLPEDAPSLLKQDLELRRLLAESHILNPTASTSVHAVNNVSAQSKAFSAGRIRAKTTDLRVQALGSKTSILTQKNMPMSIRKGIVAAAANREAKRRKEAKENGVILERPSGGGGGGGGKNGKRSRPVGELVRPGIGRLKGAELRLSNRDVQSMEGGRSVHGRKNTGKR